MLKLLCWLLVACLSFRSSVCRVVWSRRQPLADVGAVLSMLDGPSGCGPFVLCCLVSVSSLVVGILLLWPSRVDRALSSFGYWSVRVVVVMGPVHLLVSSAAEIGFRWDPHSLAWHRPGLPLLSNLAGPVQHFRAAILDAWQKQGCS